MKYIATTILILVFSAFDMTNGGTNSCPFNNKQSYSLQKKIIAQCSEYYEIPNASAEKTPYLDIRADYIAPEINAQLLEETINTIDQDKNVNLNKIEKWGKVRSTGISVTVNAMDDLLLKKIKKIPWVGTGVGAIKTITTDLIKNRSQNYTKKRKDEAMQKYDKSIREAVDYGLIHIAQSSGGDVYEYIRSVNAEKLYKSNDGYITHKIILALQEKNEDDLRKIFDEVKNNKIEIQRTRDATYKEFQRIDAAYNKDLSELHKADAKAVAYIMDVEQRSMLALEKMTKNVNKNSERISELEVSMEGNTQKIAEHSKLITINALQIDMMRKSLNNVNIEIKETKIAVTDIKLEMRFDKTPLAQKIKAVESGKYDRLFLNEDGTVDENRKKEFIKDSKTLKTRQDINTISKTVGDYSAVGSLALNVFGLDDSKGGKVAAEVLNYTQVASNIVGNLATGNIAGALMQGLGLFKKPKPSGEMKMLIEIQKQLEQLNETMNERFVEVHEHLDYIHKDINEKLILIDERIVELEKTVIELHEESMKKMCLLDKKLDVIECRIENFERQVFKFFQNDTYDKCKIPLETFIKLEKESPSITLDDFSRRMKEIRCKECLIALQDIGNAADENSPIFNFTVNENCSDVSPLLNDREIYENLDALWEKQWTEMENSIAPALMYSFNKLYAEDVLMDIIIDEQIREKSYIDKIDDLKNYKNIERFTTYLLAFFSFLEIYDEFDGRTFTHNDLVERPRDNRILLRYLKYAEDLVDIGTQQQALLSGLTINAPFKEILEKTNSKPKDVERVLNILESSPIIARNFAIATLHDALKVKDMSGSQSLSQLIAFQEKVDILKMGKRSEYNLADLIGGNSEWLSLVEVDLIPYLKIQKNINGELREVYLPVPKDKDEIERCDLLPTEGLTTMLGMKKAINDKLVEMEFISTLPKPNINTREDEITTEDMFYLIQTVQSKKRD